MKPLRGIRVVEFAPHFPGQYLTRLLQSLGAKVTKVEAPRGDSNRHIGPFVAPDVGFLYAASNRGKKVLQLDLRQAGDRRKAVRLAKDADIVVQAYRPGTAKRLGVDWSTLRRENPRLVYVEMSGWGPKGDLADAHGHDLAYQAAAGMLDPERPHNPTVGLADLFGSFWGAFLAAAALREVAKTGRGRRIPISLAGSALIGGQLMRAASFADGRPPGFMGGTDPHYAIYRCKDKKFLAVAVVEQNLRPILLKAVGVHATATGSKLKRLLEARFRTRTRAEWLRRLHANDVPAAPVLTPLEGSALLLNAGAFLPPHDVFTGKQKKGRATLRGRSR